MIYKNNIIVGSSVVWKDPFEFLNSQETYINLISLQLAGFVAGSCVVIMVFYGLVFTFFSM